MENQNLDNTFYRAVSAHTADAMALSDPDGIVLAANPAFFQLYGYAPEEIIGSSIAVIFPEERRAQAIAHYRKVFRDELAAPACATAIRRKDGAERVVQARAEFLTANGARVALLSIARDITERMHVREGLLDQPGLLETLLQQFPDGSINIFDSELRYLVAEGKALAQAGLSPQQLIGKTLAELFPRELVAYVAPLYQKALRGESVMFELPFNGRVYEIRAAPLKNARAAIPAILVIGYDITDRKQAEMERLHLLVREHEARQAAEAATQRISRLQEVTSRLSQARTPADVAEVIIRQGLVALEGRAGVIALHTEGEADLNVLQAQGFSEGVLQHWQRFPLNAPTLLSQVVRTNQAIFLEAPSQLLERYPALAEVHAKTGSRAWACVPLALGERVLGGIGITFDQERVFGVDDQQFILALANQCAQALERAQLYESEQRARAEAEDAVRVRDAFLAVASHELRNTLTALMGHAQILHQRTTLEQTLRRHDQHALALIVDQATRMNKMLATLLDMSRIEIGQLQIERKMLDIAELTRRVVADIQPALVKHALTLAGADAPLLVAGDALRLEQVLQNLIQNAIKYSPRGGTVAVEVEQHGQEARVSITDQGIGIPAEALPHLFRRFYRAETARAHRIDGTGIGLYVVKEIISMHKGEVEVASAEGKGSTFTIRLPMLVHSRAA